MVRAVRRLVETALDRAGAHRGYEVVRAPAQQINDLSQAQGTVDNRG